MAVFRQRFRLVVLRAVAVEGAAPAALEESVRRCQARPSARAFVRTFRDAVREMVATGIMDDCWREASEMYRARSPLWRRQQRGYAADLWRHLLAPNSFDSFAFLFWVAARAADKHRFGVVWTLDRGDYRRRFFGGSDRDFLRWRAEQRAAPHPNGGVDHLQAVVERILRAMAHILLLVPYLDVLREAAAERVDGMLDGAPP